MEEGADDVEGDDDPIYKIKSNQRMSDLPEVWNCSQAAYAVKQGHNAHNLLLKFRSEEGASSEKDLQEIYKKVEKKAEFHVNIPPELCVAIDMSISVVNSFYLLPSMMHITPQYTYFAMAPPHGSYSVYQSHVQQQLGLLFHLLS